MRARTVSKITGKSSRRLDLMAPLSRSNISPLFKFDSSSIEGECSWRKMDAITFIR